MYSEQDRRAPMRRSNDEFLRRMIGGELTGGEMPVMNMERPSLPDYSSNRKVDCEGNIVGGESSCTENQNHGNEACTDECPTHVHAPVLAMVYSPRQCWRNVLDPQSGLENGSMFAELILPFEGCGKKAGTEVKTRR